MSGQAKHTHRFILNFVNDSIDCACGAFIVSEEAEHRLNAHDDLLAACEAALDELWRQEQPNLDHAARQLQVAIAKATQ